MHPTPIKTKKRRNPGGRPAQITRDGILDQARLIPIDELTMPAVARRLGVQPAALYYHFDSREALLKALGAQLMAEFPAPKPDATRWRPWLSQVALDLHAFMLRNPAILTMGSWVHVAGSSLAFMESVLVTLESAGFSLPDSIQIWSVVANHAYANAHEVYQLEAADQELRNGNQSSIVFSEDYPHVCAMAAWYANRTQDGRTAFEESMSWLIAMLPEPAQSLSQSRQSAKRHR